MFDTVFGLPLHPLVVHATVVIVPAAALAVLLAAVSTPFRRWAGVLPLLLSIVAAGLVPISTASGESLEQQLPHSDLIENHAHLADGLLVPVIVMLAGAAGLCWVWVKERTQVAEQAELVAAGYGRGDAPLMHSGRSGPVAGPPRIFLIAVIVVALTGAAATTVQVARIGHSGAKAAWSEVGQASSRG